MLLEDILFDEVDEETAELYKERQNNTNGIIVFPWVFKSGFVNNTETGYVPQDAKPENYSYFERVFTGRENIQVIWEDSTKLVKPLGVNRYDYTFKVGKHYLGSFISGQSSQGVEIDTVTDNDDFLAIKDFQSVKLRFDFPASTLIEDNTQDTSAHYFYPKEEDRQKLYTIPELCGNKWLMITDVSLHTGTIKSDIVACEITFTSVGDKLRKSGRATEQYIQYGAPGDAWCLPTIKYVEENDNRVKKIGYKRNIPKPITHFQVEMLGGGAISGITIWGRKLKLNASTGLYYFENYKFLLPYEFFTPQNNDINRTSTPSKSLFYFPNETLELFSTKDWDEAWKSQNNAIAVNNQSGRLSMSSSDDWDTLVLGEHKSNKVLEGSTIRYDYFDKNWFPTAWLGENQPTLDCKGNAYTENKLTYRADMNAIDILIVNSFAYLNQLDLPLGFRSSKPYRVSNMPIIGGLVAAIIGDRTINSNTKEKAPMKIGYFMDCDLAGYLANRGVLPQGDNHYVGCFVNNLCGEDIANWLGVECCNLSFCFSLTDKIQIHTVREETEIDETHIYDTVYIGQSKKEDGTHIFDDELPLLFNTTENTKVQAPEDAGFVIDKVLVQGLFAGKIRLSAYNIHNNELTTPVWTTTVISNAKWTGSMRNWTTEITTGGWDDRFIDREDNFTWPEYPSKEERNKWNIYWAEDNQIDWEKNRRTFYQNTDFSLIEMAGDTNWRFSRNNDEEEIFTTTYSELGLPDVNDRESFFNKVSALRINYRGTEMVLTANAKFWVKKFYSPNTQLEKTHNIELVSGRYEYVRSYSVYSFNYEDEHTLFNQKDYTLSKHTRGFIWTYAETQGLTQRYFMDSITGFSLKANIRIVFNENNIVLRVKDISFFQTEDKALSGEWVEAPNLSIDTSGTALGNCEASIKYHFELNHISFVLK